MCTGVIGQVPLITLQTPRTMVVKTIGVHFGIVIEGLPYIIGLNVSQNQWRMAISGVGIIPGKLTWGEIRALQFRSDKRGWRYNGGQYSRGPLYTCGIP